MNLQELKDRCYKYKNLDDEKSWYGRYFAYPAGIRITQHLIDTNITANQVTVAGILIGILGAISIAFGSFASALFGVALLQFGFVLDGVDGQLARFRKQSSVKGVFLDTLNHRIINLLMPLSFGLMVFNITNNFPLLLLAIVASFASSNIATTTMQYIVQDILTAGDKKFYNLNEISDGWYGKIQESLPVRFIKKIIFFPGGMNITCMFGLLYYIIPTTTIILFIGFCLLQIAVQLAMIISWHKNNTIEEIATKTLRKILKTYGKNEKDL